MSASSLQRFCNFIVTPEKCNSLLRALRRATSGRESFFTPSGGFFSVGLDPSIVSLLISSLDIVSLSSFRLLNFGGLLRFFSGITFSLLTICYAPSTKMERNCCGLWFCPWSRLTLPGKKLLESSLYLEKLLRPAIFRRRSLEMWRMASHVTSNRLH